MAKSTKKAATNRSPPDSTSEFNLDLALKASLRGEASQLNTHILCLRRDIKIGTTKTLLHCYFLPLDGNGRVRVKPLAEFLRDRIIDYAIPRKTIEEAYGKTSTTNSMSAISNLHERARGLFTHLAKSGEGGELLLFAMAEAIFGVTQIICKMTLKTSTSVHYHGSDGVYAEARTDGGLNLFWGESKIHAAPADAIRECLKSLAPFLREPEGEDAKRNQDILLVNEFANFSDERLVASLKKYLDKNDSNSLAVRHCGLALCGFDSGAYPAEDVEKTSDRIAADISTELNDWIGTTGSRVEHEKLEQFDIHFVCVPLPSASAFRSYFLEILGVQSES